MAELKAHFFGFDKPYVSTLALMHELHAEVVNSGPSKLMLLEHSPVITLTRQHMERSLKTSQKAIIDAGIEVAIADRGGDATFHGPGQLVGYPLIKVKELGDFIDVAHYIRSLEQSLLDAMQSLGIPALLLPGFTGIWLRSADKKVSFKKLIAIGVGIKDGVSKHGFALNIDIDHQRYSEHIVPCGLKDRGVATLKDAFFKQGQKMPDYSIIVKTVSESLAKTFSLTLDWRSLASMELDRWPKILSCRNWVNPSLKELS